MSFISPIFPGVSRTNQSSSPPLPILPAVHGLKPCVPQRDIGQSRVFYSLSRVVAAGCSNNRLNFVKKNILLSAAGGRNAHIERDGAN